MVMLTRSQSKKKKSMERQQTESPFRRLQRTLTETKRALGSPINTAMMSPTVMVPKKVGKTSTSGTSDKVKDEIMNNSSPRLLLELRSCVGTSEQDEQIPEIEATGSLSPSNTVSTIASSTLFSQDEKKSLSSTRDILVSPCNSTTGSLTIETNNVTGSSENKSTSNGMNGHHVSSSGNTTPSTTMIGDTYISKDDLNLVMLDKDSLEEYEMYCEDEIAEKRAGSEMRRALIQQELDNLIQLTERDEMDGHEFEPEAIEALGIAANHVCYLQKYYDVARCEYVFLPSVAYTIMNGTLLEEASKHYFGKSDDFLISYAASLGSTIVASNDIRSMYSKSVENGPMCPELLEDVDLDGEEDKNDLTTIVGGATSDSSRKENKNMMHVSDLFLGVVSPRSTKEAVSNWSSTPTSRKKTRPMVKGRARRGARRGALGLLMAAFLTFSLVTYYWLVLNHPSVKIVPTVMKTLGGNKRTPITMSTPSRLIFMQSFPYTTRIIPFQQQLLLTESVGRDDSGTKLEEEFSLPATSSDISTQLESQLAIHDSHGLARKEKKRLRRPIVANLLY